MADNDWYKPNHVAAPRTERSRGERLWSLRRNGRQVDCELRFHGDAYGWECQCLLDGELADGRRFVRRELALQEAEAQRERLSAKGWVGTQPAPVHDS